MVTITMDTKKHSTASNPLEISYLPILQSMTRELFLDVDLTDDNGRNLHVGLRSEDVAVVVAALTGYAVSNLRSRRQQLYWSRLLYKKIHELMRLLTHMREPCSLHDNYGCKNSRLLCNNTAGSISRLSLRVFHCEHRLAPSDGFHRVVGSGTAVSLSLLSSSGKSCGIRTIS